MRLVNMRIAAFVVTTCAALGLATLAAADAGQDGEIHIVKYKSDGKCVIITKHIIDGNAMDVGVFKTWKEASDWLETNKRRGYCK